MSLAYIQILVFISYCSPVQGRKHMPAPVFTSSIAWYKPTHFKRVWTPLTDKSVSATMWEDSEHDEYAVNDWKKMHISREVSKMYSFS